MGWQGPPARQALRHPEVHGDPLPGNRAEAWPQEQLMTGAIGDSPRSPQVAQICLIEDVGLALQMSSRSLPVNADYLVGA